MIQFKDSIKQTYIAKVTSCKKVSLIGWWLLLLLTINIWAFLEFIYFSYTVKEILEIIYHCFKKFIAQNAIVFRDMYLQF